MKFWNVAKTSALQFHLHCSKGSFITQTYYFEILAEFHPI